MAAVFRFFFLSAFVAHAIANQRCFEDREMQTPAYTVTWKENRFGALAPKYHFLKAYLVPGFGQLDLSPYDYRSFGNPDAGGLHTDRCTEGFGFVSTVIGDQTQLYFNCASAGDGRSSPYIG